jgi:hypothetical protein
MLNTENILALQCHYWKYWIELFVKHKQHKNIYAILYDVILDI